MTLRWLPSLQRLSDAWSVQNNNESFNWEGKIHLKKRPNLFAFINKVWKIGTLFFQKSEKEKKTLNSYSISCTCFILFFSWYVFLFCFFLLLNFFENFRADLSYFTTHLLCTATWNEKRSQKRGFCLFLELTRTPGLCWLIREKKDWENWKGGGCCDVLAKV